MNGGRRPADGFRLAFRFSSALAALFLAACDQPPAQSGLYYWGAEVNVVCPCGSTDCYWVRGDPAILGALRLFVQKQTSQPYQPVFLTYRGRIVDEPTIGFAANYEGYEEILEVGSVSIDLPQDCPAPHQE